MITLILENTFHRFGERVITTFMIYGEFIDICTYLFTRSMPLLSSLHLPPVRNRIILQICTITSQAFSRKQPSYFHSLLTPVRKPVQLRSSSYNLLFVPKVNTIIETRAFAVSCALFGIL